MVANNNLLVNLLMHIVVFTAIASIFIVTKENLRRFIFHAAVGILFTSVTLNAVIFGNPFHAVTFGILALTALVQPFVRKNNIQISSSKWNIVVALFFILIGLWYPEFVEKNALMLLMVSPVGIIPCPTLLTAIGLLLIILPSVSRVQYVITIIMGIVYGVIGVMVFKVYLDIALLVLALYAIYICFRGVKIINYEWQNIS